MKQRMQHWGIVVILWMCAGLWGCAATTTAATSGDPGASSPVMAAVPAGAKGNSPPLDPKWQQPKGLLYRVEKNGQTHHLYGTLHRGRPEFYPLPEKVTQALARADRIAVEANTMSPNLSAEVRRYGMLPKGESLYSLLSPEDGARLKQFSEREKRPQLHRFSPYFASLALRSRPSGVLRFFGAAPTIDQHVVTYADLEGKPLVELEGIRHRAHDTSRLPMEVQLRVLQKALDRVDRGAATEEAKALAIAEAWARGDEAQLLALTEVEGPEADPLDEAYRRAFWDERNRNMLQKLEQLSTEGGGWFAGVGAGHLLGAQGLVALLRKAGYTVTRVNW